MKLKIEEIRIKKRIRSDLGDLDELCQSMNKYGLLNPVTINRKKILLAGFRRLEAAKVLGWQEIECNIVDASSKLARLEIEAHENTTRKDFTEDEIHKLEEKLELLRAPFYRRIFIFLGLLFRRIISFFRNLIARR